MRHLAEEDGDGVGKQRILDANEVEGLASSAGCQEYVEVSKRLWWIDLCLRGRLTPLLFWHQHSRSHPKHPSKAVDVQAGTPTQVDFPSV